MKNNSTFMRIPQILACWMLMLLCGLPAHAGYWKLKEYRVEKYIKNQNVTATPDGQIRNTISGFDGVDDYMAASSSPRAVKKVVPAQWPQGGNSLIQFYANLSHYSHSRDKPLPAGEAIYRLAVTPVFEWIGGPDEAPTSEVFYVELCRVEVSRNHAAPGGTYGFGDFQSPYNGSLTTYEQTNPWGQELFDNDHTTPHGGVIRSADLQFDMCWTWKYERIKATGTVTHGKTRNFSGKVRTASFMPTNNSYGASASIGVVYEAHMAHFSLDVNAPDAQYLNNNSWDREVNAYASRAILGGAPDSTPESTIESLWVGGVDYAANLSPNLRSHFGDIKYGWDSSSQTLTSKHFSYGRELMDWPNYGANSPIYDVPDEEWISESTRTKSFYHDLGDKVPTNTTVELKVTDNEKPASELRAKAKINWYQQPSTAFEIEVETVAIDLETGAEVSLDSGGEYSTEEAYNTMKAELRGTIQGGSEIAGTVLEVAGSFITPDLYDVILPAAGAAGKRVYKFTKGAARVAAVTSRVRGLLSGNSAKLMSAARTRLGKGADHPVIIRIRTKETLTGQKGKLPPNSTREKLPENRVTKKTEFLGQFCFVPGTLVDTQNGKRVIESLKAGDLVWAKDESTGAIALKPIAQTFERVAPSTLVLTFANGEKIETTIEHPFYVQDKGFTPAGLVAIGNSIVTRAGPSLEVTAVEKHESAQRVYNFEVEDFHTYFVGDSALWTHNVDCTELNLGRSTHKNNFKDTVPTGKNWEDLGLDPSDPEFVNHLTKLMDETPKIHFDLSGLDELNTAGGVLTGPTKYNPRGSTNWELRTIWDNPVLKGKTTFYRDGKVLTEAEVLALP